MLKLLIIGNLFVEIKYINPEHNVFTGRIINRRILNKPYNRGDIIRFEDIVIFFKLFQFNKNIFNIIPIFYFF